MAIRRPNRQSCRSRVWNQSTDCFRFYFFYLRKIEANAHTHTPTQTAEENEWHKSIINFHNEVFISPRRFYTSPKVPNAEKTTRHRRQRLLPKYVRFARSVRGEHLPVPDIFREKIENKLLLREMQCKQNAALTLAMAMANAKINRKTDCHSKNKYFLNLSWLKRADAQATI